MPSFPYNAAALALLTGNLDFADGEVKAMLVTKDYVPDQKTHRTRADVWGEVVADGCVPGGLDCDVSIDEDQEKSAIIVDLGGGKFEQATITARYAVYYLANGGDAEEDELIACNDFGGDVSSTNGTFMLSDSTLTLELQTEDA